MLSLEPAPHFQDFLQVVERKLVTDCYLQLTRIKSPSDQFCSSKGWSENFTKFLQSFTKHMLSSTWISDPSLHFVLLICGQPCLCSTLRVTDFLLLMKVLKLGLEITSPAQLFTACDYNPQASRSLKRNVFIKPSALLCYRNQCFCAKKLALEGSEDTNFKGDSMFCGILVYWVKKSLSCTKKGRQKV